MHGCHPRDEQLRQDFLDDLYRRSGRDRKDHPMHSLYTGLYQEWTQVEAKPQEVG
jgi:hypothetical protein